jgi:hypothetical protein
VGYNTGLTPWATTLKRKGLSLKQAAARGIATSASASATRRRALSVALLAASQQRRRSRERALSSSAWESALSFFAHFGFESARSSSPWPQVIAGIEALDPDHLCDEYWAGKQQRDAAIAGALPARGKSSDGSATAGGSGGPQAAPTARPAALAGAGGGARKKARRAQHGAGGAGAEEEDDPEAAYRGNQ